MTSTQKMVYQLSINTIRNKQRHYEQQSSKRKVKKIFLREMFGIWLARKLLMIAIHQDLRIDTKKEAYSFIVK